MMLTKNHRLDNVTYRVERACNTIDKVYPCPSKKKKKEKKERKKKKTGLTKYIRNFQFMHWRIKITPFINAQSCLT